MWLKKADFLISNLWLFSPDDINFPHPYDCVWCHFQADPMQHFSTSKSPGICEFKPHAHHCTGPVCCLPSLTSTLILGFHWDTFPPAMGLLSSLLSFFLSLCSFCLFHSLHFLLCLFFFLASPVSHLSLLFLCHPLLCWKWKECQRVHSSRTANTSFPGEGDLLCFDLSSPSSVLSACLLGVQPF